MSPTRSAFVVVTSLIGLFLSFVLDYVRRGRLDEMLGDWMYWSSWVTMYTASPYALLLVLSLFIRPLWLLTCSLFALVAIELWLWLGVSNSTSSTAALGLFFIPIYQTVLVLLPTGIIAWIVARRSAAAPGGSSGVLD